MIIRRAIGGHWSEFLGRAAAWASVFAIVLAIPADLIDTPLFSRMTPATWVDYSLWALTSTLGGFVMGARRLPGAASCEVGKPTVGGEALGFLAVACPVCNKVIVVLLGASGALTYFAPIQPVIGLAGALMLAVVLRRALLLAARGTARLTPPGGGDLPASAAAR